MFLLLLSLFILSPRYSSLSLFFFLGPLYFLSFPSITVPSTFNRFVLLLPLSFLLIILFFPSFPSTFHFLHFVPSLSSSLFYSLSLFLTQFTAFPFHSLPFLFSQFSSFTINHIFILIHQQRNIDTQKKKKIAKQKTVVYPSFFSYPHLFFSIISLSRVFIHH